MVSMKSCYASDILPTATRWLQEGRSVVVGTIIHQQGSSSAPLAARMICNEQEEVAGAVSGGCVESDLARQAQEVIRTGTPRLVHYGPRETTSEPEPILEVGLACGGAITVLLEPLDSTWLAGHQDSFCGVVTVQVAETPPFRVTRTWYPREMPFGAGLVRDAWESGAARSKRAGKMILLAEPVIPAPTVLVFGATPVADALVRLARVMGYSSVISDPREARFSGPRPVADEELQDWPDQTLQELLRRGSLAPPQELFVVSLDHEPRFEDALWEALLEEMERGTIAKPAYTGAIGQKDRALERQTRARQRGLDLSPLEPIYTPVGMNLGGKAPAEVALSIIAQIVASRHGRPGGHLA
ncbi:xanthine dehydrogenase accessory factor [Alkalispirochaeta americana]|uniref:Xanthine dehydrogenase accessory factor n=1 Tax=Alkalispirochaeta americana TaxID=159291 RepID=A0A1N6TDA7_9SPIO|nr:XdhC family protein [Alkalispirochaeta americana]SIQ51352.1 xanthine dehydrogenase accessory factor [Alkalispirochaeta americana]